MKVYAVYSIPKSPEYCLEQLFLTKQSAKEYVSRQKEICSVWELGKLRPGHIYDIQIEDVIE